MVLFWHETGGGKHSNAYKRALNKMKEVVGSDERVAMDQVRVLKWIGWEPLLLFLMILWKHRGTGLISTFGWHL